MSKTLLILGLFTLVFIPFNGGLLADQITASSSLNWGAATFSGSVAPTGAGGNPTSPSEGVGAFYQTLSGVSILSCGANAFGWTPIQCNERAGQDSVAASADSELNATAAASVGYLSTALVYRDGTISVGTNGDVNIDIPFSATIAPTEIGNCGPSCNYFAQVEGAIFLSSISPNPPFGEPISGATILNIGNFQESDGAMSIDGILDLTDTGLTPGTYRFDVQTVSQVRVTPEPSTILLLVTGLLAVAALSLRKGFA